MAVEMPSPPPSDDSAAVSDGKPVWTTAVQREARQWQQPPPDWLQRRRSSGRTSQRRTSQRRASLVRLNTGKRWWKFTLRPWDDDEYQDWWFAGTAIPLLAATIGPLANVFSIAALVTYWRMCLVVGVSPNDAKTCTWNGNPASKGPDLYGQTFEDPRWCYWFNVASLILGFVGNFFLLCNFTGRIRYIIALPVTIVTWYLATAILIGITVHMQLTVPPIRPQQTYTQGFWYAVLAACMYLICSMMLMVNMLGYFLGHYSQKFTLTDSQRTLILQTMLFFIWLAGGAIVFSTVENKYGHDPNMHWSYVNALYFCDVTILTVGFGDLYPTSSISRGLNFPYSVGGIIMLGLMVSSISSFATELGSEKIIRKHVENTRARTLQRTVTTSLELERRQTVVHDDRKPISAPMNPVNHSRAKVIQFAGEKDNEEELNIKPLRRTTTLRTVADFVTKPGRQRKPKLLLLREEKDRFDAMRDIQKSTSKFKRWYALCLSLIAFAILWCVGAAVFWQCEKNSQGMTYFQALYFCYVCLLTIGYGDLAPLSNAGRPFFVLWSLIAVPTMTILVSDLGSTVIDKFKNGTGKLADFTVLPKYGVWRGFVERHPILLAWLKERKQRHDARHRLEQGFQVGPEADAIVHVPTIEELAADDPSPSDLARRLAEKIRQVADDMKHGTKKRYSYEEWVEITQLIRFSAQKDEEGEIQGDEVGLIDWDWIGLDSPMMSSHGEPEFVLDRLCESMHRYIKYGASTVSLGEKSEQLAANGQRTALEDDSDDGQSPHGLRRGRSMTAAGDSADG